MLNPMQDLVAKESESEEVRLGIGQRVKIINRAQLGQHFPKPVHEAMLSTPGDEGRCLPTFRSSPPYGRDRCSELNLMVWRQVNPVK